jgi:hypothetical protein
VFDYGRPTLTKRRISLGHKELSKN